MAQTPIISLNDIALTFGGEPVLDGVSVTIQEGDRIALVGRNGSGKSTLMKVLGGLVEPDRGTRVLGPGFNVAMLEQDPIRRAALARLMAADAEALLLDEPTNHLDIDGILWLEAHLKASGKTFVLISHDRAFLSALIKAEQKWSVEGISARRTRDMGRVRRLREMKSNRAAQRQRVAAADLQIGEAGQSGKLVVDAKKATGWPLWGQMVWAKPRWSSC